MYETVFHLTNKSTMKCAELNYLYWVGNEWAIPETPRRELLHLHSTLVLKPSLDHHLTNQISPLSFFLFFNSRLSKRHSRSGQSGAAMWYCFHHVNGSPNQTMTSYLLTSFLRENNKGCNPTKIKCLGQWTLKINIYNKVFCKHF